MNQQTRNLIARALLSAAARLEAGAVVDARLIERSGIVLRRALKEMGVQSAVAVRLIETLLSALASSELTDVHKIDVLAAVIDAGKRLNAEEAPADEDEAVVPPLLAQVQKHLRKALLIAHVPPRLAAVIASMLVQGVAAVRVAPDVKRSLLATLAMDIESAMVGVPASRPSIANPESKNRKRKAKLVESKTAIQQQIENGKLRGTVKQHVRIAREFEHKHKAALNATREEIASLAPAGADVKARVKTLDSAVGKVARKPKDRATGKGYESANELQDGTGIRVVAASLDDVASTVKRVKEAYDVIEEDDYITFPKEGYRSYHLVIRTSDGLPKELQVRTKNMHTFAEWCHDLYKPQTPAQKEALAVSGDEVRAYMFAVAKLMTDRDEGRDGVTPPCPVFVREAFGCIE